MRTSLRWIERALFTAAALLLAYCGAVLVDGWVFQRREGRQLAQFVPASHNARPDSDGIVGRLQIPRLGVSVIVMEGVDASVLAHAAGHVPGTALPGQLGNVGISAHRDTFFRPIRNIRKNDLVTVTTPRGEYRYRVVSTQIVTPQHVEVLDPTQGEILTLVTCYPFYFIGPAPKRFIVKAERITQNNSPG